MKYGPVISGTFADSNCRFYDDKSTYTGVHKNGGPTIIDKEKYGLESRVSRKYDKFANLLVKKGVEALSQEGVYMQSPNNPNKSFNDSPVRHVSLVLDRARETPVALRRAFQAVMYETSAKGLPAYGSPPHSLSTAGNRDEEEYSNSMKLLHSMDEPLKNLFLSFSLNLSTTHPGLDVVSLKETGMDSTRWAKFCRDSNLSDGITRLQPQDIDLIFMRAKNYNCPNPKVVRKLNYSAFRRALILLAEHVKMPLDQFMNFVLYSASSGLSVKSTTSEYNRTYNDSRTYTGVHKRDGPTVTDVEEQPLSATVNRAIDDSTVSVRLRTSAQDFVDTDTKGMKISQHPENCDRDVNDVENADSEFVSTSYNNFDIGRPPPPSVFSGDSANPTNQSNQQSFIEERIGHFQELHVAQQKEYLYLDSKLSEEMMKLEHDLQSKGVSSKFYRNLSVEETETLYNEMLQKRVNLKEKFRHEHEV